MTNPSRSSYKPLSDGPHCTPSLLGHLRIARLDHWVKNVFVFPGTIAAIALTSVNFSVLIAIHLLLGLLSVGLVASSNYTINEVLDAPFDRNHPTKRFRPVSAGAVNIPLAYVQWIVLGGCGIALGFLLTKPFAYSMIALWIMGCVYNIPPLRTKDKPYFDVLSEAVNNPLRMMAGWFLVTTSAFPPGSLLLSYWMVGCYFMAIKRFAESRQIGDRARAAAYRKSLAAFSPDQLLIAVAFYGSAAMLFFGAFCMRYRVELILGFPFVALVMAQYLALGFEPDSAAQNPEKLYRSKKLMTSVVACSLILAFLLLIDLPSLRIIFSPEFIGKGTSVARPQGAAY